MITELEACRGSQRPFWLDKRFKDPGFRVQEGREDAVRVAAFSPCRPAVELRGGRRSSGDSRRKRKGEVDKSSQSSIAQTQR